MKRKIITIDENLCNGCGDCVLACAEGAIEIVDGKAKLVKEQFCDGFGDCLGECPTGALRIEDKEAESFDPEATKEYLLQTKGREGVDRMEKAAARHTSRDGAPSNVSAKRACPGARAVEFSAKEAVPATTEELPSQLSHWPIQFSLVSADMAVLKGADLLIAADCTAFAYGDFHRKLLAGRPVIIGCPKLDDTEPYVEKLANIIKKNDLKSLTVVHMEVPCCHGMAQLAKEALKRANSKLELQTVVLGIRGEMR